MFERHYLIPRIAVDRLVTKILGQYNAKRFAGYPSRSVSASELLFWDAEVEMNGFVKFQSVLAIVVFEPIGEPADESCVSDFRWLSRYEIKVVKPSRPGIDGS